MSTAIFPLALDIAVGAVSLAVLLCSWRLVRGPQQLDRVLALDTLYINTVALVVLLGLRLQTALLFEAALVIAMLGFVSSVARSVLLQRNTPREMRGRVFSAFYVMRDLIFLLGMAGAGLADIIDIRLMIVVASALLLVSAAFTLVAPGIGLASMRAASQRLREATGLEVLAGAATRPATLADFDLMATRLGTFGRLSPEQRSAFVRDATVREFPAGTRIVTHGDVASSAYFILAGSATAGIPDEGGFRGLATMEVGDFFGEIAALTGSPRTADVVAYADVSLIEVPAEALRATMVVPEIQKLVFATLTSRLLRTESADLPRLAGVDQEALRDLRTPRPSVETLPRSYPNDPG